MNIETTLRKINTLKILFVSPADNILKIEYIFERLPIHHILVMENEILKGIDSKIVLLNIYRNSVLDGKLPNRSVIRADEIIASNLILLDVNDT